MARKRKGRCINGVLLVDKPTGVSSNHVVQHIKRLFNAKKAGHTGALDPLATGLLPVCLGEATKFSQCLLDAHKSYYVTAKLGERTDTSDSDGEIVSTRPVLVSEDQIKEAAFSFLGEIMQTPSMFSALKHQGKPLYWYARQGIEVERPARKITIFEIDWIGLKDNFFTMKVKCSKGTYIRTLVDDIGEKLECGAHVTVLKRTSVAHFNESNMHSYQELESLKSQTQVMIPENEQNTEINDYSKLDQLLLNMDSMVESFPSVFVENTAAELFQKGGHLDVFHNCECGEQVKVYRKSDHLFLGLAYVTASKHIQPKRVVVY